MDLSAFSGPKFQAAIDALQLMEEAAKINEPLGDDEIHSICYFARIVAAAMSDQSDSRLLELPYIFTLGRNGGPFSNEMASALDEISYQGWCFREPAVADDGIYLYSLGPGSTGVLSMLARSRRDPHAAGEFIRSVVHAMMLRPLPIVVSAVRAEPSLSQARLSGVSTELSVVAEEFVAWVRKLAAAIDNISLGAGSNPYFLVPAILDLLSNVSS